MTEPTALELLEELCTVEARLAALIQHGQHVRSQLQAKAVDYYRAEGMAPTWRAANLGTLTLPIRKPTVRVKDPEVFTSWAAQRHTDHVTGTVTLTCSPSELPDLVEAIQVFHEDAGWPAPHVTLTADSKWLADFLDNTTVVVTADSVEFFAPDTGEAVEGLAFNEGGPGSVSVRLNPEAKRRAAIEAGASGAELLAPLAEVKP